MHKPSLSQLVHGTLFPKPRSSDPSTFAAHITRHLVPEVRLETSTFYGALDCIEAQYPGLDYSYPPHRMRLSRYPHHRRLFRAFDELDLTEAEIASLCRWEGTKSARDRYERDEDVRVRDTTADDVRPSSPSRPPSVHVHSQTRPPVSMRQIVDLFARQDSSIPHETRVRTQHLHEEEDREEDDDEEEDEDDDGEEDEEESSDEEVESYGIELNQRLLEAAAARERGANVPLDEDWEQWLKEAIEHDGYADVISAIRAGHPLELAFSGTSLSHASSSSALAAGDSNNQGSSSAVGARQRPPANRSLVSLRSELAPLPNGAVGGSSRNSNAGTAR